MHQMVLLRKEVQGLRTAEDILDQTAVDGQLVEESRRVGRKPRSGAVGGVKNLATTYVYAPKL